MTTNNYEYDQILEISPSGTYWSIWKQDDSISTTHPTMLFNLEVHFKKLFSTIYEFTKKVKEALSSLFTKIRNFFFKATRIKREKVKTEVIIPDFMAQVNHFALPRSISFETDDQFKDYISRMNRIQGYTLRKADVIEEKNKNIVECTFIDSDLVGILDYFFNNLGVYKEFSSYSYILSSSSEKYTFGTEKVKSQAFVQWFDDYTAITFISKKEKVTFFSDEVSMKSLIHDMATELNLEKSHLALRILESTYLTAFDAGAELKPESTFMRIKNNDGEIVEITNRQLQKALNNSLKFQIMKLKSAIKQASSDFNDTTALFHLGKITEIHSLADYLLHMHKVYRLNNYSYKNALSNNSLGIDTQCLQYRNEYSDPIVSKTSSVSSSQLRKTVREEYPNLQNILLNV